MVAMVNFHLRNWPRIIAMENDITPMNPIPLIFSQKKVNNKYPYQIQLTLTSLHYINALCEKVDKSFTLVH